MSKQMTRNSIKIFMKEIYSKQPKQNYPTNKTDVHHIDDTWSSDVLNLKDYETNRGYRYFLVIIDNFSKYGRTVPPKKNAETIKDSFETNIIKAKRKRNLTESDRGRVLSNNNFQIFLKERNIKHYSRNSSYDAVFAERFNRTIRNLPKRRFFEKGYSNWIDVLPILKKQYNNLVQSSIKLTPIQASLKRNEGYVYKNLLDKRKK